MIILDTNIVSEAMKPDPHPGVRDWLNAQAAETLHLSSVVLAELLFGSAALPDGKRRDRLTDALDGFMRLFAGRILSFDVEAAQAYAALMAEARTKGVVISTANGLIAATATANDMMVATRDTGPFQAAGIGVVNPWGNSP